MKPKKLLMYLALALMLASLAVSLAKADSSDTSTGTATVTGAAPTVTSVKLGSSTEDDDVNNTALTVSTEYHLNFTVGDANTLTDLDNITILAWDNRGQDKDDGDSQRYHYTWTWVESTDTWACPLSASYIVGGSCDDPGTASALTTYDFTLAFQYSKVANYSNGGSYDGWQFNITAYDDEANAGSYGEGTGGRIQHGIAAYYEVSVTDSTHTWSAAPNSNNNAVTAGGDAKVDFTVISNRVWKAQCKADGNLIHDSDYIVIANLTHYGSDSVGDSAPMTTDYADITGITSQAATADEGSADAKGVYLWLDVPNGTPEGEYVYELTVQATAG